MAATASFKQQCPSCEAWVPIRDANLIGRKIDCPKCKYRFVVEDPGPASEDEEDVESPAGKKSRQADRGAGAKGAGDGKGTAVKGKAGPRRRDEEDEEGKSARGKGGSSTKLILGIGLGVVAVGILAAVAVFIFINNEKPKPAAQQSRPAAPAPAAAPAAPVEAPAEEGEKPAPAPAPAAIAAAGLPGSIEVLTNLLPPDTEGVCDVRMKDLLRTSLGRTIFATPGAFRSEVIRQRLGLAVEDIDLLVQAWNFTHHWSFNVIHSLKPIHADTIKSALRARPAPEGKIEDQEYFLLEPNPWLDSLGKMSFAAQLQIDPAQVPAPAGKRALRIVDDQTLVLADLAPMKQFLAVKGRFPPKQQPKEPAKDANNPEETGQTPTAIIPRRRGGPPQPAETPPADAEGAPPTSSGAYLTINPSLKNVLDVVERKQPVVSLAVDTQAARGHLPPLGLSALEGTLDAATLGKLALKTILEEAGILGASLRLKDGLSLTLAEDCQSEDTARKRSASLRRDIGPELVKLLSTALGTPVEMVGDQADTTDEGAPGGRQSPFGRGEPPGRIGGSRAMPNVPGPPRPGVLGSGGGRSRGSPYGGPVYGGGQRGNLPAEEPGQPQKPKPGATIGVEVQENTLVLLTIDLTDQAANNRLMNGKIRPLVLQQKGYLDMVSGQPRIHELGDAAIKYTEAHAGQFPRGTHERRIPPARAGRPYEPKQRVSWLAELLPYLGPEQASLSNGIDRDKSWNDPANLAAAATLVPQFLNPNFPPNTWWVRYPNMMQPTAATHYVGIAGIGADAAEYSPNDPATVKKLGVFGYDRTTRVQDITDGVSNTILIAQVPPTYKRPWLAGGGSTVEGVPEKGSVQPFVSPQPDGKRGTLVVMADGSVRFVAENVKDEIFKALCTIKGGETDFILDRDAPPVPRPEGNTEPPPPVQKPSQPTAAAPTTGEWKEFTSKEGGFTASFPSAPSELKQSLKTPAGNVEVNVVGVEFPDQQGFLVTYHNLPDALSQQPEAADLILETIPQQVKANASGATITGEIKKITQDGHPGREFNMQRGSNGFLVVRALLVKNRVYQVIVAGSKEMVSSKDAQRFLDSFHLN
jgi:hypothetical protein